MKKLFSLEPQFILEPQIYSLPKCSYNLSVLEPSRLAQVAENPPKLTAVNRVSFRQKRAVLAFIQQIISVSRFYVCHICTTYYSLILWWLTTYDWRLTTDDSWLTTHDRGMRNEASRIPYEVGRTFTLGGLKNPPKKSSKATLQLSNRLCQPGAKL